MATKIGVIGIINEHFNTYRKENDELSFSDWLIMVVFPLAVSVSLCAFGVAISNSAYTNIVTAGAIFTGLLLNLLVLVYDQKTKLLDNQIKGGEEGFKNYAIRKRVIDEVHYNISYCIIICLLAVVVAVVASSGFSASLSIPLTGIVVDIKIWALNFPLLFACMHLVLTILMILKRVHKLISSH